MLGGVFHKICGARWRSNRLVEVRSDLEEHVILSGVCGDRNSSMVFIGAGGSSTVLGGSEKNTMKLARAWCFSVDIGTVRWSSAALPHARWILQKLDSAW